MVSGPKYFMVYGPKVLNEILEINIYIYIKILNNMPFCHAILSTLPCLGHESSSCSACPAH